MADEENNNSPQLTKADIVRNISQALAKRREARGLSLEKVYQAIKIRPQLLTALEKGNWHELPGDVYVKGFIIRYAQFMGMDGTELIKPYLEFSKNPVDTLDGVNPEDRSEPVNMTWIWAGIGMLVLIGVIKVFIADSKPAPKIENESVSPLKNQTILVSSQTAAAVEPVLKHKIKIIPQADLWLRVATDKKTFEGNIPQQSTWTFEGEGRFNIKLGHSKDVAIYFDGRKINVDENQRRINLPNEN